MTRRQIHYFDKIPSRYSSRNFRNDSGEWEWHELQKQWAADIKPIEPPSLLLNLLGGSSLLRALGGNNGS